MRLAVRDIASSARKSRSGSRFSVPATSDCSLRVASGRESKTVLRRGLRTLGASTKLRYELSDALLEAGDEREAIAEKLILANELARVGSFEPAIQVLDEVLALVPNHAEATRRRRALTRSQEGSVVGRRIAWKRHQGSLGKEYRESRPLQRSHPPPRSRPLPRLRCTSRIRTSASTHSICKTGPGSSQRSLCSPFHSRHS